MRRCVGWIIESICKMIIGYKSANLCFYADLTINPIQKIPRFKLSQSDIFIGEPDQNQDGAVEEMCLSSGDDDFYVCKKI